MTESPKEFHLFLTKFDWLEVVNYLTSETKELIKVPIETSESYL